MVASERIHRVVRALQQPLPGDVAKAEMWPDRVPPRAVPDRDYRRAAVLVLLWPDRGHVCFPLMVRKHHEQDVHSGQISLPGGQWEPGESLQETALREAEEELGIDPAGVELVGDLSMHRIPVSKFEVLPVVGIASARPDMVPDPTEVDRILISSLEELEHPECRSTFDRDFSGRRVRVPCWNLDGGVLWGATAMILAELLHVARS